MTIAKPIRRLAFYVITGAALLLAVDTAIRSVRLLASRGPASLSVNDNASASAPSLPYTIVLREESSNVGDKTVTEAGRYTMALRADGARAQLQELYKDRTVVSVRKLQFPNGDSVVIDEAKEVYARSQRVPRFDPEPERQCVEMLSGRTQTILGEESVAGYSAVKIRVDDPTAPITVWRSLKLSCAILKQEVYFKAIGVVSTKTALTVTEGEPAEWLFDIPDRYESLSTRAVTQR